jgi:hypothetical protein
MPETKPPREIRNIMEYPSGLLVCFDQHTKRIDDYYGPKEEILPKLRVEDLSRARIKRLVNKGSGSITSWVEISKQNFLLGSR